MNTVRFNLLLVHYQSGVSCCPLETWIAHHCSSATLSSCSLSFTCVISALFPLLFWRMLLSLAICLFARLLAWCTKAAAQTCTNDGSWPSKLGFHTGLVRLKQTLVPLPPWSGLLGQVWKVKWKQTAKDHGKNEVIKPNFPNQMVQNPKRSHDRCLLSL